MKLIIILMLILTLSNHCKSSNLSSEIELTLNSKHLWRGMEVSKTPCLNPQFSLNYNDLFLKVWAAHSIDDSYNEIDFIVEYNYKNFKFSLFDYFCPIKEIPNRWLDFTSDTMRHTLDFVAEYKISESFPLTIMVSNMFYGDRNTLLKEQYSTYIQTQYSFDIDNFNTTFFVGFTPYKSYYATKAAVINSGLIVQRKLQFEKFSMPLSFQFNLNPHKKDAYVNCGIGFVVN